MNELEAAVAALRQDPSKPVRAKLTDITVELRAVPDSSANRTAAEVFASLGPWEGESTQELLDLLSAQRPGTRGIRGL